MKAKPLIVAYIVCALTTAVVIQGVAQDNAQGSAQSFDRSSNGEQSNVAQTAQSQGAPVWKYIGAAMAVGFACIGGGLAVGQIGAAAMGAMAEKPELSGKALPYVGLAEGICLWGFLVALIMLLL